MNILIYKEINLLKPITKAYERKDHKVKYSVIIYNKNTKLFISNQLEYIHKDIGISTTEVVLILLSIILYAGAILFIWFSFKNLKLSKQGSLFEKEVRNTQLDRLVE